MSTQPVSQEFGANVSAIPNNFSIADKKDKGKRKTRRRVAGCSKKLQAKSKVGRRKSRTEKIAAAEIQALENPGTIEPKEILPEEKLVIEDPVANGDMNCLSSEPVLESWPGENESTPVCNLQEENFPLVDNSFAGEVHVANESVATAIAGPAVETAELVEQTPATPIAETITPATFQKSAPSVLCQLWSWIRQKLTSQQARKRLRVCETVSLGEKRFVAVIQVDGQEFLVGGSSTSVSTLAQLEPARDFSEILRRSSGQELSHA